MRISRALFGLLLVGCFISVAAQLSFGQGDRPQRGQGGGAQGGGGGRGGMGGGGFGGGGMASLLMIKEVREELKIDEDQNKEIEASTKALTDEMRSQFGGAGGPGGGGGTGGGGAPGGAGGRGAPGGGGRGGAAGGMDMTKIREAMASMQAKSESKLDDVLDPIQMDRLCGLFVQRDGVRTLSSKAISTRLEITEDQKTKIAGLEKESVEEMRSLFGGGAGGAGGAGGGTDMREKMDKMRKDSEEKVMGVLTADQKAKMEEMKGAKFDFPAPAARGGGPGGTRGDRTAPQ